MLRAMNAPVGPRRHKDFRTAWRSLQRLRRNPDDTQAVFELIGALPPTRRAVERSFRRFAQTPAGARVLAEERDLLPVLQDRAALRAMPPGSLGRSYADFTEREQLSADGLVQASQGERYEHLPAPYRRFVERRRDSHDLEHVVTGYGRDLRGEASVLCLDTAQTWHPGIALIVATAWWESDPETRRMLRSAWRRGRNAAWLPGADWEKLLPLPLSQVREELRLGPPPAYQPIWSSGAARQAPQAAAG